MEEGVWGRVMTEEFAPIDKSEADEAFFKTLDLINRHYSESAEILENPRRSVPRVPPVNPGVTRPHDGFGTP